MGGDEGAFQPTRWSVIRRARTEDEARRRASVENLLRRYWRPVYCYLRYKGYDNESAKDLTQKFFHEVILGRELIQKADQEKGRFRTFLLTSLDRFLISEHRRDAARKRRPDQGVITLDMEVLANIPTTETEKGPEHLFCYAWASDILDQVLVALEEEYCGTGRPAHWYIFREKVVEPILGDVEEPSLTDLCRKYDIENEKKASNMLITVKRRFGSILHRTLRASAQSDHEVQDEIAELMNILSGGAA